jgi:hypothetical protein
MSLLEEALTLQKHRNETYKSYTNEEIELAVAWLEDRVGYTSVSTVRNLKNGQHVYSFLAIAIREAYRRGLIKIESQ